MGFLGQPLIGTLNHFLFILLFAQMINIDLQVYYNKMFGRSHVPFKYLIYLEITGGGETTDEAFTKSPVNTEDQVMQPLER